MIAGAGSPPLAATPGCRHVDDCLSVLRQFERTKSVLIQAGILHGPFGLGFKPAGGSQQRLTIDWFAFAYVNGETELTVPNPLCRRDEQRNQGSDNYADDYPLGLGGCGESHGL